MKFNFGGGVRAIYLRVETCQEVKNGHASSSLRH